MKIINLESNDGYMEAGQLVSFQNEIYEYQLGQRRSAPIYILDYNDNDDWKHRTKRKSFVLRAVAHDGTRGDYYAVHKYFDGHWSGLEKVEVKLTHL